LQYPLIETATGLFSVFLFWRFLRFPFMNFSLLQNINLENLLIFFVLFIWLYWVSVLIIISVYDFKKYLILNEVLVPAIIFSFIWKIIFGFLVRKASFYFLPYLNHFLGDKNFIFGYYSYSISMLFGIIFACGVISFLAWVTRERAMGWGDAILALFMGIILGWPEVLIALVIAFLLGGFVASILLLFKKKTMKSYLPFAPFLSLGAMTVMCFGDIIIEKYLSLLF
jgi:prepilin signal peptidase PulO-like enzyme (type II secretory pathway)